MKHAPLTIVDNAAEIAKTTPRTVQRMVGLFYESGQPLKVFQRLVGKLHSVFPAELRRAIEEQVPDAKIRDQLLKALC